MENKVYNSIMTFLNRKAQNSLNTSKTYRTAYKEFFLATRGKKLEDLTEQDLIFTTEEIENYQVELRERLKTSSVNTKMFALKSLYEKLQAWNYPVEPAWFDVESYDEFDKKGYDPMTHAEIVEAINIVSKTQQGKQKALLIRLAYATAFRRESLLQMKKTDIINRDGVWLVRVLGKGQRWDYKKITNDLHDELMARCAEAEGERIFTLGKRTVNNMMKLIRSKIDFGERTIAFHSLKNSSVEEVRVITNNDLMAMQSHANHKDSKTTIDNYLAKKRVDDLVMVDINYHVPVEAFQELSHEELLELVMGAERNTQIRLLQNLGVI